MSKEKLYRNKNGEYLYLFNWIGGGVDDDFADLYGGEVFLLSKGYSNPKEVYFQVEDSVIEVTQAQKGLKNIGIFYYTENFENQIDKQLLAKISSDFGNEFSITLYTNAGVDLHSSSKGKYKNIQVERLKGNYKKGGGGFNDEWGLNKREAIKKVMKKRREGELKYPTHVKLRIDLKTMRRCTYSEYQQQNRMGWMLTM